MLQDVVFPPELSKTRYRARRDELKERLMVLQQQAVQAGMGTVIIVEGWGAAGKGSRISDLVVNLDPRAYSVHTMEEPVGYEARLPFMARYWSRLGAHGTMTIFDQAYYDELSRAYVEDVRLQGDPKLDPAARSAMARHAEERIREHIKSALAFESQLEADGYLIVRFFLHITRPMQSTRIMDLMCDPSSAWKVDDADIRQIQHYDEYESIFDRWLYGARGERDWVVVPAEYRRNANIQIMEELANRMDEALRARGVDTAQPIPAGDAVVPASWQPVATAPQKSEEERRKEEHDRAERNTGSAKGLTSRYELKRVKTLAEVREKEHVLDEDTYHRELKEQQARLSVLTLEMYRHRVPLVIAYEGWDAAGKGGNIKRVTAAMDARDYRVCPIGAPSKDELAHPFLWRFWVRLPRSGHAAIFDRTWYGRVLVERIEGFATEAQWRRAYDEINEFEDDLRIWGAVLVKFWVDVSPDEQLRRFRDRENDPARRWKITAEDWRNREKNDLYYRCVDDMLRLTSTAYAPWHVIPSDDKRYARVKALKTINNALEKRLKI